MPFVTKRETGFQKKIPVAGGFAFMNGELKFKKSEDIIPQNASNYNVSGNSLI